MRKAILILIGVLVYCSLYGFMTSSSQSGDWSNNNTWSSSQTPPDVTGDSICISFGDVVTISSNITYNNPIILIIKGTLFLSSSTFTLPSGSQVIIENGGIIDSNNNGSGRLNVGSTSWGGIKNNPIMGPVYLDDVLPIKKDTIPTVKVNEDYDLKIYPNPVIDKVYLNVGVDQIESLYFYAENGSIIEYKTIKIDENTTEIDFNTDSKRVAFVINSEGSYKAGVLMVGDL